MHFQIFFFSWKNIFTPYYMLVDKVLALKILDKSVTLLYSQTVKAKHCKT